MLVKGATGGGANTCTIILYIPVRGISNFPEEYVKFQSHSYLTGNVITILWRDLFSGFQIVKFWWVHIVFISCCKILREYKISTYDVLPHYGKRSWMWSVQKPARIVLSYQFVSALQKNTHCQISKSLYGVVFVRLLVESNFAKRKLIILTQFCYSFDAGQGTFNLNPSMDK